MDRRLFVFLLVLAVFVVGFLWWPKSTETADPASTQSRQTIEQQDAKPDQRSAPARQRGGKRVQAKILPELPIVESLPNGVLGVHGQVILKATGEPISNAIVHLSDHLGEQNAILSGGEGYFAVEAPRQGHVTVQAGFQEPGGVWLESQPEKVLLTQEQTPAGPVTLVIGAPASAVVVVVDRITELPVRGAAVKRLLPQHAAAVYTDPNGRVAVHGQIGSVKFNISAAGYATQLANIELTPAGAQVIVRLDQEAIVRGVVQRSDGTPVAGAKVGLASMVSPRQEVLSGGDGSFEFQNIIPFKPHLLDASKVLANGKLAETSSSTFVTQPQGKTHKLVLESELDIQMLDQIVMGRVMTEQDQPIPDVDITVFDIDPQTGLYLEMGHFSSDQEGYFSIQSMQQTSENWRPPIIVFRHPYFAPTIDMMSWAKARNDNYSVTLRPGGNWQGRVVDQQGKPVANVAIRGTFGFTEYQLPLFEPEVILAASDGQFLLNNLPRVGGITFQAEGYAPKKIELAGYKDLPEEVILLAPRKLAGTVLDAVNGQPVASFSLEIQSSNVLMRGFQTQTSASQDPLTGKRYFANADGRFELEDLPLEMDLSLWFTAEGYASRSVTVPRQQQQVSDLVVEMEREGLTIAGTVVDEYGNPFPGATVWLTETKSALAWLNMPRSRLWGMMTQAGDEMVATQSNGSFRFEDLTSQRDWALVAWAEGTAVATQMELLALAPSARENVVLQFPASGGIKFIVNPERGFDIKNISYAPVETPLATKSKSLDVAEFTWEVSGLAVDTYNVRFRAVMGLMSGGSSRSYDSDTPVTVIAGEIIEVPLGFENTLSIGGRALWNGSPLVNASIFLLEDDGSIRSKVFSSATGEFLFEEIEEGYYEVFAPSNAQIDRNLLGWPVNEHPNRIAVDLKGSAISETFEFLACPNLVGQLANPDNVGRVYLARPIPGSADEFIMIRRLDTNGTFLFHGVPEGVYELRIWKKGEDGLITVLPQVQVTSNPQAINLGILNVPE